MLRFLKFFIISLFSLALILVVAAVVIPMVVDPNDYKSEIATLVKDQTGRSLEISGDIQLSLFPWVGLKLGAVELGNADGFGPNPMAIVEAADLRVKLLP
ncbi:MAG: AsmA family protein, partial [Magnetococcales bacterium]|nr:AsmA family protein [Magnetococcales bacterium]